MTETYVQDSTFPIEFYTGMNFVKSDDSPRDEGVLRGFLENEEA